MNKQKRIQYEITIDNSSVLWNINICCLYKYIWKIYLFHIAIPWLRYRKQLLLYSLYVCIDLIIHVPYVKLYLLSLIQSRKRSGNLVVSAETYTASNSSASWVQTYTGTSGLLGDNSLSIYYYIYTCITNSRRANTANRESMRSTANAWILSFKYLKCNIRLVHDWNVNANVNDIPLCISKEKLVISTKIKFICVINFVRGVLNNREKKKNIHLR